MKVCYFPGGVFFKVDWNRCAKFALFLTRFVHDYIQRNFQCLEDMLCLKNVPYINSRVPHESRFFETLLVDFDCCIKNIWAKISMDRSHFKLPPNLVSVWLAVALVMS